MEEIPDTEAFLAPYRALYELRRDHSGDELLESLRAHMDYDGYLRWLAVNSLLRNGDYIDEIYFYDLAGPAEAASPYFAVMAWDYDDIFNNCHTPSPLDEPLMYCAESGLDRPVRDDDVVQAAYVRLLREMMTGPLSGPAYEALLDTVVAEMSVYLERPGVSEIMTRDELAPDLDAGREHMLQQATERRQALEALLGAP